jgi:tetratricopeptide (TPR) repeat protein
MKTVYRFLVLSVMMAAFAVANTSLTFAQDEEKTKLYTDFIACYKETDKAKRDACYALAKQYLDKFGTPEDEYVKFVKARYTAYEKALVAEEKAAKMKRFDDAVKNPQALNVDQAFSAGREVLTIEPDLIDVPIALATIGFDQASAKTPNTRYVGDAINYAKTAIQKIEAGKPSVTGSYGVYAYSYKTKDFPDGKNNALGWMNYIVGYMMFNHQNQKKEAMPYFFKASQMNSATKTYPELYRQIGSWYVEEFIELDKKRVAAIAAAGNQDTEETKQMLALQKGLSDRALEAYAKAYHVAPTTPEGKVYRDSLLARTRELYGIRFENEMSGFDAYLATAKNKALTDPTVAVTPVVEATPTTVTNSPGTTPAGGTTMNNTSTTPAPAKKPTPKQK